MNTNFPNCPKCGTAMELSQEVDTTTDEVYNYYWCPKCCDMAYDELGRELYPLSQ